VFVVNFAGDLSAGAVAGLRQEVTAILSSRREGDEVVLRIESLGGVVASYGLAASQVVRLKAAGIRVTVCVDRAAASGGYMMACVADRILAAPFAVVGSIGVVAQLPNFHRLLKRYDIDFEQFHAGKYKRTVTLFGENTEADRAKVREQVEEVFELFKEFVGRYRPSLDVDRVATGEYWYGSRAVELGLVDELRTSDDYLLEASREAGLFEVRYMGRKPRPWWLRLLGNH
jgi:serine protease SohB